MVRIVIFALLMSTAAWSRGPDLLKCLGAEEKTLHLKKDMGPVYDLNQRLIAEIIQIPGVNISRETYNDICNAPGGPSWNLLRLSIIKGKSIFQLPSSLSGSQKQITEGMIEDYIEATKEILLNFITQIQALAPDANCLKREIPQLETFFTEIKYLQDEVEVKTLFAKRDKMLLKELKNYPEALQRCRARLNRKPKSGSKEPKKS